MKIAQIAPIIERVPPKTYGGTERVVCTLTEELVRQGHDVTLFASKDSKSSAKIKAVLVKSARELKFDFWGYSAFTLYNIAACLKRAEEFDVIHDHNSFFALGFAELIEKPLVVTCHGDFDNEFAPVYRNLKNARLVAISKSQASYLEGRKFEGVVYNGLSMEHYPFSDVHEGYLLYVGRISMQKGVHFAVQVAKALGLPLILAAKVDVADRPYFDKFIKPHLSEKIRWIGEVDERKRNQLMCKALCLLHPVTWPEPFGLTLIESMACGCPVVAFGNGSIPEVVLNNKSGFVVRDVKSMIRAVNNISSIDRKFCRKYSLENFSAGKMAEGYLKIYKKVYKF